MKCFGDGCQGTSHGGSRYGICALFARDFSIEKRSCQVLLCETARLRKAGRERQNQEERRHNARGVEAGSDGGPDFSKWSMQIELQEILEAEMDEAQRHPVMGLTSVSAPAARRQEIPRIALGGVVGPAQRGRDGDFVCSGDDIGMPRAIMMSRELFPKTAQAAAPEHDPGD